MDTFKLECAHCGRTRELPQNPSVWRIQVEAEDFYRQHKAKGCSFENIFIRTFSIKEDGAQK